MAEPSPPTPGTAVHPPPTPSAPPAPPGKLTLIGAGHVFAIRDTLRDAVTALAPDMVFLELDQGRLNALLAKARGDKLPPPEGAIHRRLAAFQERVAAQYGADVGLEMLGALEGARRVGAKVALVDGAADAMLRRAIAQLTWRERLRAVGMAIAGAVKALGPRRGRERDIEAQLARYQKDPAGTLAELQASFPTLHRVLIAERDEAMAKRIRAGLAGASHGVAVVGDGHVEGLLRRFDDLNPTVYRLGDVREGRLPRAPVATGSTERVGFTVALGR